MIIGNNSIRKYQGFAVSVLGASHKESNICQDYSGFFSNSKMSIAVACDGHGSSHHFRSEIGSKLATEIGIDSIKNFVLSHPQISNSKSKEIENLLKQLKEYIIYTWNEKTLKHFNDNPLTVAEIDLLRESDKEEYLKTNSITNYVSIYGTTFVGALITNNFWFILQIGDGDAVILDQRGFYMPVPIDEANQFQYTSSICEKDAIDHFRHFYGKSIPIAIMLSTDGLKNSFVNTDYLYKLYKDILLDARIEDVDELAKGLQNDLPVLSMKGSGDDISLSMMWDPKELLDYSFK